MTEWTPEMVEERLVEAAEVLRRLPPVKVQGYFNTWPDIIHEFGDLVGQEPRMRPPAPPPDAITRMDQTLEWTIGLEPLDVKIVWLRASGKRWKQICWETGLSRAAADNHFRYALRMITWKLNGRPIPKNTSRRAVIAITSSATAALREAS